MRWSLKFLRHFYLRGPDGVAGRALDFLFDETSGRIRHVVVELGMALPGRLVLMRPREIRDVDALDPTIRIRLSCDEAAGLPPLERHKPASMRLAERLARHENRKPLWGALASAPGQPGTGWWTVLESARGRGQSPVGEATLRSAAEVMGYAFHARDGESGVLSDLVAEEKTWTIRTAVVRLHPLRPGRSVDVPYSRLRRFRWADGVAESSLRRKDLAQAPLHRAALTRAGAPQ